jgi:hypothetical protein
MKTKTTLLFWTLILFACTPGILVPQPSPTPIIFFGVTDATGESSFPFTATVETPNIDPSPTDDLSTPPASQQDCAFIWAYHDLPELTTQFDTSIKALSPNASAHATAFGEDCIALDGQVIRFAAMETDFYVTLPVTDLNDYESFGDWITQVMQVVNVLPPDMLAGPNPGFVEFRFEKTESESIGFRVPIQQYNTTATGITGEELLRMFYTAP